MHRSFVIRAAATVALVLAPGAALAKDKARGDEPLPPVFQAVADCRNVAGDAERLACYDRNVATMVAARDKNDLVVADRETLRETKRGLFGFSLPRLKIFGGTEGEDVNEIQSTVTSVRRAADGFAIFAIADGAHWKQTDGGNTFAKSGDKITISRGALGSYWAKINKDAGVRVVRLSN